MQQPRDRHASKTPGPSRTSRGLGFPAVPGCGIAVATLAGLTAIVGLPATSGEARGDERAARIIAVGVVPEMPGLRRSTDDPTKAIPAATSLGGLSDLCIAVAAGEGRASASGKLHFWTVTDRGPNGFVETADGKRRTLVEPEFVPSLVRLTVEEAGSAAVPPADTGPRPLRVTVTDVLPLATASGRLFSGRANGLAGDSELRDPTGSVAIAPDPHGVDTEGVVQMPDGSFWLAEEYRPSLLKLTAAGRCSERFTPAGQEIPGSEPAICDILPARLARRQDNRGLEALATPADGSVVFALLQSPLRGEEQPKQQGGLVPLLAFDPATGRTTAELAFPLDADTLDGKLSAMAAFDAETLLVLEHCKTGRTRLHAVCLPPEGRPPVGPIAKRLVADLTPLLARMGGDVWGRPDDGRELKLEGLAILAADRIAILNDNDFGVPAAAGDSPRSCLWIVELPAPLGGQP